MFIQFRGQNASPDAHEYATLLRVSASDTVLDAIRDGYTLLADQTPAREPGEVSLRRGGS